MDIEKLIGECIFALDKRNVFISSDDTDKVLYDYYDRLFINLICEVARQQERDWKEVEHEIEMKYIHGEIPTY